VTERLTNITCGRTPYLKLIILSDTDPPMTENVVMLRAARRDDLPAIQQLERAAGAAFRDLGMSAVADDEPPSITDLASFQRDGSRLGHH
jgi:hypothetical protein